MNCAPVVGQRRKTSLGHAYRIARITTVLSPDGVAQPTAVVVYDDEDLNRMHPFCRLWPLSSMENDIVIGNEVAPENRARVTAGPPWMSCV